MAHLDGTWIYESFCSVNGASATEMPRQIVPWAPRGELKVTTDATTGRVTGKLSFAPGVDLTVSGTVTPVEESLPEGVDLSGEGLSAVYKIRGFFIPGSFGPVVVGTVVAVQNDLAKQPDGTSGPFVLFLPFDGSSPGASA